MSRSRGDTSLTRTPPMRISPEVICSSPASIRSAVVLPQPDGPTSTTNSPWLTVRVRSRTAQTLAAVGLAYLIELERRHRSPLVTRRRASQLRQELDVGCSRAPRRGAGALRGRNGGGVRERRLELAASRLSEPTGRIGRSARARRAALRRRRPRPRPCRRPSRLARGALADPERGPGFGSVRAVRDRDAACPALEQSLAASRRLRSG